MASQRGGVNGIEVVFDCSVQLLVPASVLVILVLILSVYSSLGLSVLGVCIAT